ncbi:MAG: DUF2007 domain-containing protein [Myxococcaceae bacterium]|nr:DUF2007 domain-containing protein [Myxococcaceae bacterium]
MRYCTECGAEYNDSVTECADDGNTELVTREQMHERGLRLPEERDTREFVRAGTADDPLSAERLTQLLDAERIPVFTRARRSNPVDALTVPTATPWWEILVPEEHVARAAQLIHEERKALEAEAEENARAAEEEALESQRAGSTGS